MTKPRIEAADFAVEINPRNSKNDHIVFDVFDSQSGEGGRFVATRRPGGRLAFEVTELGEGTDFAIWRDEPLPFDRWEVSPGMTIEDWRQVTTEQVIEMVGSVETAWHNYENQDRGQQNQMDDPWTGLIPPLGTVGYDPICRDFSVLLRLDSRECGPAEPEDCIKQHPTYKQYVKWARFGLQPPPMAAWDRVNFRGELGRKIRTGGRRRTLAAQEAGRRGLLCWWSPASESGVAKWRLEEDDPRVGHYRERHRQKMRRPSNGQGGAQ